MSQTTHTEPSDAPSTSQRVIEMVAEETGNEPTEVGPLYHVVDPDALDRLFSPTPRTGRSEGYVEFAFAGCDVAVHGDGTVEVAERELDIEGDDRVRASGETRC